MMEENKVDEYNGRHEVIRDKNIFERHNKIFRNLFRGISGGMDIDQMFERNGNIIMFEAKPFFKDHIWIHEGQHKALLSASNISDKQKVYYLVFINEGVNDDDITHVGNIRQMSYFKYTSKKGDRMVGIPIQEFYKVNATLVRYFINQSWKLFERNIYDSQRWKEHELRVFTNPSLINNTSFPSTDF